jgi:hypothetical protein
MDSESVSLVVSGASLCVAGVALVRTWHRERARERQANVTAYLHRTSQFAKVHLPDGEVRRAGYHLVIANTGAAPATGVIFSLYNARDDPVRLLDVGDDEFPLDIDAGAEYPIPLLLNDGSESAHRRFRIDLEWHDPSRPTRRLRSIRLRRASFRCQRNWPKPRPSQTALRGIMREAQRPLLLVTTDQGPEGSNSDSTEVPVRAEVLAGEAQDNYGWSANTAQLAEGARRDCYRKVLGRVPVLDLTNRIRVSRGQQLALPGADAVRPGAA